MKGLLYKNFRINFMSVIAAVVVTLLCCVSEIITVALISKDGIDDETFPELVMISASLYYCAFLFASMTMGFVFQADESKVCSAFNMSVPQGGRGHIKSKYLYILIVYSIVLFMALLTDAISFGILRGRYTSAPFILFMFFYRLLLSAVEVPFIIRFGSIKGTNIKGLVVLGVSFLMLIYFMFGDISWLIGSDDVFASFTDWLKSGKVLIPILMFPFFTIGAYWLSCKISVRVFRKGAENYEQ